MSELWAAAHAADISTFPIRADGSKAPALGSWKPFQSERVDDLTVASWQRRHSAWAWVCGKVSGRLVVFDLEGGFVANEMGAFAEALQAAGLYETVQGWISGCSVETPSGGLHIPVRVSGDGAVPANRKFAFDEEGNVLAELRGEGGYVVGAGSNGAAHPSGRPWRLISGSPATVADGLDVEVAQVAGVLIGFDRTPPRRVTQPAPLPRLEGVLVADSLIERSKTNWPSWSSVLERHGFVHVRDDPLGPLWRHASSTNEHSLRINLSGRAYVWSWGFGGVDTSEVGNTTFNVGEFDLICELHRVPSGDEFAAWCRRWLPGSAVVHPGGEVDDRGAGGEAVAAATDTSLNLADEFWNSRTYLSHVRQAALARRLSPDAVWEAVKCLFAATIPWNHRLPDDGTMDYISILVGHSGAGKSRAKQEAYNLLVGARDIAGVALAMPVGSGEGMTELFLADRNATTKYQFRGINFYADEGKFLLDISSRAGNTTVQILKQMWSGELTGQVAATKERHRWLPPRDVRATCLVAATPSIAVQFLRADLTDEGLPQRISWAWAHYLHGDVRLEHPGPLQINYFDHNAAPSGIYEIELDPEIAALVDAAQLAASRGDTGLGYEGHAIYATLKCAAIHAHLDGRMTITSEDWVLAEQEWSSSRKVRAWLLRNAEALAADAVGTKGAAIAHQRLSEDPIYLEKAAQAIVSKILTSTKPFSRRQIKDHLRPFKQRHGVHPQSAIDLAEQRQWIVIHNDNSISRGPGARGGSGGS